MRYHRTRGALIIACAGITLIVTPSLGVAENNDLQYDVRTESKRAGKAGPIPELSPQQARAQMMLTHDRNKKRLKALGFGSKAAETADIDVDGDGIKDVAVVVDNGRIIVPARAANPLDLQPGMSLRYTPVDADTFRVELATGQNLDPTFGAALTLTDDDFAPVSLGAPVPFLGAAYDTAFVGSDGHITFGEGDGTSDSRNAVRHTGGPPRLSPLLTDLNPECRGTVHADVRADRLLVTWNDVVHFNRGISEGCAADVPGSTLQMALHSNGVIDFVYGALDGEVVGQSGEAVTGIAEGDSQGPFNEIDMTADLPADLDAGAIFEQFSPASPETFDLVELSREFYRTHDDKFDQLVMFTDFAIGPGSGALAFNAGVQNQTLGLGQFLFDISGLLGSAGELESFIWMNNILAWAGHSEQEYIDPPVHNLKTEAFPGFGALTPVNQFPEFFGFVDLTGPGNKTGYAHHGRLLFGANPNASTVGQGSPLYSLNSPISIMFQEADHRWAAFAAFEHPTKGVVLPDSLDLLGRGFSHWSTFFNTGVAGSPLAAADGNPRFSGMEGNSLIELERVAGKIRDKNDPARVIADPNGELARGLQSCTRQGKGMFLTEPDELVDGATELDQYLMGVRTADQVSPFWYADEPSSPIDGRSLDEPLPQDFLRGTIFNLDDIAFCGTRVNLTAENITAVGNAFGVPNGERVPAIGDENDIGPRQACLAENLGGAFGPCADVKTMAFILLVRTGPPMTKSRVPAIERLNEFRKAWQTYTNGPALGGRNADGQIRVPSDPDFIPKFDTSLEPAVH